VASFIYTYFQRSFNGGGFLRQKDTSFGHSYGTMQNAKSFGMVIVGGQSSGSS